MVTDINRARVQRCHKNLLFRGLETSIVQKRRRAPLVIDKMIVMEQGTSQEVKKWRRHKHWSSVNTLCRNGKKGEKFVVIVSVSWRKPCCRCAFESNFFFATGHATSAARESCITLTEPAVARLESCAFILLNDDRVSKIEESRGSTVVCKRAEHEIIGRSLLFLRWISD